MWFFNSPEIVYGEDALSYLEQIQGRLAFIVTDARLHSLGYTARVQAPLHRAGISTHLFAEVEPEPSIQTVQRGAQLAATLEPDWIIGLGGGSAIDAAKAILALYERPDLDPAAISPVEPLNLHKAKLLAIPTTSGTGSETTWAVVLTDPVEKRKLGLANRELVPRLAIVDPSLTRDLPPRITADTGLDALTHAIEGYTSTWHNDFSDGLCLKACQLIFTYLVRAVENGANDPEAREHMANAASLAGLGFGNSNAALAHAMGHSLGGLFHLPHGRSVALFLPYTIEFTLAGGAGRYADIARFIGLTTSFDEAIAGPLLVDEIRALQARLGQPTAIDALDIPPAEFEAALDTLCDYTEMDTQILTAPRVPDRSELERLFHHAYHGIPIDF